VRGIRSQVIAAGLVRFFLSIPRPALQSRQQVSWDENPGGVADRHEARLRFWLASEPSICWLLLGVVLCALSSGCRSSNSRTIAVIPRTTGNELWESVHKGAAAAGRQTGFHIYWNAPTREDDIERQIGLVEKVINDRPAGLVLAPDHYLALVGPVRHAMSQQIPTVIISSPLPIPPGQGLSYILNDDQEMGRMAAMRVGMLLKGKGTVGIVGLATKMMSIIARARAFEAALNINFPQISIVAREGGSPNIAEIQQIAREMLVNYPHLDAILALDSVATIGSLDELRAQGRAGSTRLIGCDQDSDLMFFVRQGEVDSVIIQNSNEMGSLAVRWIAARTRGEAVPDKVELTPVLVNKSNIDTPEIQRLLAVDWRSSR
jgi:ribose transport system substrate-binding protein